jgi:hypothetical protein
MKDLFVWIPIHEFPFWVVRLVTDPRDGWNIHGDVETLRVEEIYLEIT